MNLNGQSSKNQTILNGKPLYGYDRRKHDSYLRHTIKHQREVQRWQTGKQKQVHFDLNSIKEFIICLTAVLLFLGALTVLILSF